MTRKRRDEMSPNVVAVGRRRRPNLSLGGRNVSKTGQLKGLQVNNFTSGPSASSIAESADRRGGGPQSGPRQDRPGGHPAPQTLFQAMKKSVRCRPGRYRPQQNRAPERSGFSRSARVLQASVAPLLYPRR